MARKGYGRATTLVNRSSYPDDNSYPVGTDEWNSNRDTTGIIGFTKKTEAIDGSNQITVTDSYIEITNAGDIHELIQTTAALSSTYYASDTTTKSYAEGDLLYLIKANGVGTVTLHHQEGGAGAGRITTLSGSDKVIGQYVPTILICRTVGSNLEWFEYGGGSASDLDTTNFAGSALVIESEGIGSNDNDTTIPTSAAVKAYVDASPVGDITSVVAGDGLTGGGTAADVTLTVVGGTGITANANDIAIDSTVATLIGTQTLENKTLNANCTFPTLNQNTTGSSGSCTGNSATATLATTVTITDNESTNEDNAIIFTAGGDTDGGSLGLESDGTCTYNPSTGKITATGFVGALTGNVTGDCSGTALNVTGTVAVAKGGTNTTSYAVGDILYASGATALTKLNKPSSPAGEVLTFASGATAPSWVAASGGGLHEIQGFDLRSTSQVNAHSPASGEDAHMYVKQIDTNNDGLFIKIKKNGTALTEVQLA